MAQASFGFSLHPFGDMATVWDVRPALPPHLIAGGLKRLWVWNGGLLEPVRDDHGAIATCPISLSPMISPVLLTDGFVYEEAEILKWLQRHGQSPCTNLALTQRKVVRLTLFKEVIDNFLKSHTTDDYLQTLYGLRMAMQHANNSEIPSQKRLDRLEKCIQGSMDGFNALIATAHGLQAKLRAELEHDISLATRRLLAWWRGCVVRKQVAALKHAAEMHLARNKSLILMKGCMRTCSAKLQMLALQRHYQETRTLAATRIQRLWRRKFATLVRKSHQRHSKASKCSGARAVASTPQSSRPRDEPNRAERGKCSSSGVSSAAAAARVATSQSAKNKCAVKSTYG